MAISAWWRFKSRQAQLGVAVFLSLLSQSLLAASLFYQPLQQDSRLTGADWQQLVSAARRQGANQWVMQWGRYGDFRVGQQLPALVQQLKQSGQPLWQGLYADPDYFRQRFSSAEQRMDYLRQQLELSAQQLIYWQAIWPDNQLLGWYLPIELNDGDLADPQLLAFWQQQLSLLQAASTKPVAVSLYYNGQLALSGWTSALSLLEKTGVQLWLQDGEGAALVSKAQRARWQQQLGCRYRWIAERFRQSSTAGQPFVAEPVSATDLSPMHSCAAPLWFELRYLPDMAEFFQAETATAVKLQQ